MDSAFVLFLVAIFFLMFVKISLWFFEKTKLLEKNVFPYRLRNNFLSPAELLFYKYLRSAVGEGLTVQSKVRLADIFFVSHPDRNMTYFSRIAQKHVDFLVCDSETMKPLFGVELDDSSHNSERGMKRDRFVEKVFRVAGLPLLRFPVQRKYDLREIAARIETLFRDTPHRNGAGDTPF